MNEDNNNNKKILVVEDEATLQKALTETLVQNGYNVLNALDGLRGLEIAREEKPDLILLDIILPKMDGFEVLKKLKEDENVSEIPIIILTNLSDASDIQKTLDLGATTYLVKADFHLKDVLKKIEETLDL